MKFEQMTKQEVFDHVATHLIAQDRQSVDDEGLCMYRDPYGRKCAAGCLIEDSEYDSFFEGVPWSKLIELGVVPSTHSKLISRLQCAHDDTSDLGDPDDPTESWNALIKLNLRLVANEFGLSAKVLDQ